MAILNWLKMMWATAVAVVQNMIAMVGAWIMSGISQITGFFTGIGSFVANVTGASTLTASVTSGVSVVTVIAVVIAGLVLGMNNRDAAQLASTVIDCQVNTTQTAALENTDADGIEAVQLKNAKTIYSVLSAWGMSDANVAGILGNWQAESGIDPTSVQNNSAPRYQMDENKHAAAADLNNGIGLGQWTSGRNERLRQFAAASGNDWWTLTTQLAFMISDTEGANATIAKDMIVTDQGTPAKAAMFFHDEWERSADTEAMAERRSDYAAKWFALMSGWEQDHALADSVLGQAGTTLADANENQLAAAKAECRDLEAENMVLRDGGLTVEEAQKLVDLYNAEGDAFLDGRYGQYGGPSSCGDNHAMNCVSFSVYFLNKYTTFQSYPSGTGDETALTVSAETSKDLLDTPVAYSVASGPGSGSDGHTLVVLGVEGDRVIVGEASYCAFMGQVTVRSAAGMMADGWVFVDLNDMMLPADQVKKS